MGHRGLLSCLLLDGGMGAAREAHWSSSRSQSGRGEACEPAAEGSHGGSHPQPFETTSLCEPCEGCEPFPASPFVRTRVHARVRVEKGSQGSQGSHFGFVSGPCACEPSFSRLTPPAQGSHASALLRAVPEAFSSSVTFSCHFVARRYVPAFTSRTRRSPSRNTRSRMRPIDIPKLVLRACSLAPLIGGGGSQKSAMS